MNDDIVFFFSSKTTTFHVLTTTESIFIGFLDVLLYHQDFTTRSVPGLDSSANERHLDGGGGSTTYHNPQVYLNLKRKKTTIQLCQNGYSVGQLKLSENGNKLSINSRSHYYARLFFQFHQFI